ncbi:MAG: PAS domain-containing sensor histidine kinase [Pseudomonadota bacterium]
MAVIERSIVERVFPARGTRKILTVAFGVAGPVLLVLTFLIIRAYADQPTSWPVRAIVIADLFYVVCAVLTVMILTARLFRERRKGAAGSRLHLRLGAVFAALALLPTILVALFAAVFLNLAVEGWFSDRVQDVVGTSLSAAEAYEREQQDDLTTDARLLAGYLNGVKSRTVLLQDGELRSALAQGQGLVQRGLKEAFIIDGAGNLMLRGENSYLFNFDAPSRDELQSAQAGDVIIIEDWENNEFRAIYQLSDFVDRYLYIARNVDGNLLNLLDETQETAIFYNSLQANSDQLLYDLGLVYLFFAIVVTFSAIMVGLWYAEQLARPVGQLASAAERVGQGDLDARVDEGAGVDEFSLLGKTFNQMTSQVRRQRDDLLRVNAETEEARLLFDSVLSNVTAGVIGLTDQGEIEIVNDAAARLLLLDKDAHIGQGLTEAVPEFEPIWLAMQDNPLIGTLDEVKLSRSGKAEVLLVRMTARRGPEGGVQGYVVSFDDVTDLVSAQRMAAWGDVARRLAHEIKNPLTPIQLSAERLRRKFTPVAGDDLGALEQYTDVIVRQAGDLRRIVDEFSKFARMPKPDAERIDLSEIVTDVVTLQKNALPDIDLSFDPPTEQSIAMVDRGLIRQAVMNIVKNAGEALTSFAAKPDAGEGYSPKIAISLIEDMGTYVVDIEDNGPGFPKSDRSRLIEPYVTERDGGTGLGLSIVNKIIEQHGGTLELIDAKTWDRGARVRIRLPKQETTIEEPDGDAVAAI